MNRYNNLLTHIAEQFNIWKGSAEEEIDWKCRLIYSVCGLMGYASSWDSTLQEYPSIEHFKSRVKSVFDSYISLYPEVQFKFCAPNVLADEIYDIYISSGAIYHLDHHIRPPSMKCCQVDDVTLTRGCPIDNIGFVSGLGTYQHDDIPFASGEDFFEMYQINTMSLSERWVSELDEAKWEILENPSGAEYLKMDFSKRNPQYWLDTPDEKASDSLMRIKTETGTMYYQYKFEGDRLYGRRLSEWKTANNGIRNYSNACLAAHNSLPSISYTEYGNLVRFKPGYLFPPIENSFVRLYSWPTDYITINSPFQARTCSPEVFHVIYKALSSIGYTFEKE